MTKARGKAPSAGHAFEVTILELLRAAGYRAERNSRAAKPRQTDIVAQGHDQTLLIEVKSRKRSIDVGDIDNLRARLRRTASDVIGVIFTTGAITTGAIKEIENDRSRETLVFVSKEIDLLRSEKARLPALIAKKRRELRLNGRAWFRKDVGGEYLDVALPRPTIEFISESGSGSFFYSKTDFAHAAFSLEIPDTGWANSGGEGVRLELRLTLSTLEELKDLFGYLHDSFGLSSNGAFSIHQSGGCWHGCGVSNLLDTIGQFRERYRAASLSSVHHSETLFFFDELRNGWVSLYASQRIPDGWGSRSDSYFHEVDLSIQLPGIPVDLSPYLDLCRYTGNDWADFRAVQERRTHTRRFKKPIPLKVVGTAVRTYEGREKDRWIVGLIARNPLYRKKALPRELQIEGSPLHDLLEMELLLCYLKDHIEYGDEVDEYRLHGLETTEAAYAQVIRPFGTWNKLVKRIQGEPSDTDGDLLSPSRPILPELLLSGFRRRRSRGKD